MIELCSEEKWTEVTHLIPAAVVVGLVMAVARKYAKASLMERIAMAVLVAVDDRRHCPKT